MQGRMRVLAPIRALNSIGSRPGVTVVTVNWNTVKYLRTLVDAVRRFSPADVRILVIDNHSTDESWSYLKSRPDVMRLRLPRNFGHAAGLDVGVSLVRTETVVTLDVDAFPISERWLDPILEALDSGCVLAGAAFRDYVHPSYLGARTRWLRKRSFKMDWPITDVGQLLTIGADGPVRLIPVSENLGPNVVGAVYGDVVYHNFFASHAQDEEAVSKGYQRVERSDVDNAWALATARYLS